MSTRWIGLCGSALLTAGLALTAQADQSVSLAWDPQSDATGFTVYYGTESGNYTSSIDAGANTAVTIPGLKEGMTYYMAVSARNDSGIGGDMSSETSFIAPGMLQAVGGASSLLPGYLRFPVAPSHSYEVQCSSNLTSWSTIWQTTAVSNIWVDFKDSQTNESARYYRLVLH